MVAESLALALADLERAELDARERRLAAAAEAERILDEARQRAASVEARTPGRIEVAVAARRDELLGAARREVEAVEAELAAMADPDRDAPATASAAPDRALETAVELVVVAVLGER